jgi:hypothetical protein
MAPKAPFPKLTAQEAHEAPLTRRPLGHPSRLLAVLLGIAIAWVRCSCARSGPPTTSFDASFRPPVSAPPELPRLDARPAI